MIRRKQTPKGEKYVPNPAPAGEEYTVTVRVSKMSTRGKRALGLIKGPEYKGE